MTRLGQKIVSTSSQVLGTPLAGDFVKNEFDVLFRDKGYNVIVEKALICPCKSVQSDHLSSCKNCGGSGWVFVNPMQTRMIMTGMNVNTEYDETARKDIGMVNVTAKHEDKIAFMDKIVLLDSVGVHHQVLYSSLDGAVHKVSTFYDIEEIDFLGQFVGDAYPLKRLVTTTDYVFSNNLIEFASGFHLVTGNATSVGTSTVLNGAGFLGKGIQKGDSITNTTDGGTATIVNITGTVITTTVLTGGTLNTWADDDGYSITIKPQISIRYKHRPIFYIWDVPRQSLVSLVVKGATKRTPIQLASKAIAKRAHMIAEAENWSGNRLLDNSWLDCPPATLSKIESIIRNSDIDSIINAMTPSQISQIELIFGRTFDYTFDTTFG